MNDDSWLTDSDWQELLAEELQQPYVQDLRRFVERERAQHRIFPTAENTFRAFQLCSFATTRVVILGQDPYHGAGQAHGLSFSVPRGVKLPPSLRNVFKELSSDLDTVQPEHGDLTTWAEQGVLLLNTVLTVREGEAHSHKKQGWERLTEAVIRLLGSREQPTAFVFWGKPAASNRKWIDETKHFVVESAHPSPLSASRGFFGSRPFSKINFFLEEKYGRGIKWSAENRRLFRDSQS